MALLGLILLAASVSAAVSIAVSNTDTVTFEVFGKTVTSLSPGSLMLLGIGLGVAGLLGLWMLMVGLRRARLRRQESREVELHSRSRMDELEQENARLREVAVRREKPTTPVVAVPTTTRDRELGASTARESGKDNAADAVPGRDDRHVTPTMAAAPSPIDLRDSETGGVYPQDQAYAPSTDTPAFAETAKQQGGRVFGRRNR
jgi:uncharacterized integral membrane protein